ncbi:MAG: hypothetical protein FWD57_07310 [Polyangiaceae bacterium]|nr:hypothetical protein [Polyangiaceae bacterium]
MTEASNQSNPQQSGKHRIFAALRAWWFVPIILVAVVEIILHISQTRPQIGEKDWPGIRESLESQIQPADLVAFSPLWIGPIARMNLGDGLMTIQRVARADESRFPRAFEVSLGSSRNPAFSTWPMEHEERIGGLRLRRFKNPGYMPVIDDLVGHADGSRMTAEIVREEPDLCTWRVGRPVTGGIHFGTAHPAARYHCKRNVWVGETVSADINYTPRRCIYAPPPGYGGVLRLRFGEVQFGAKLHGHHALYVESERHKKGAPVRIVFSSGGESLGEAIHEDGQGWVGFVIDTPDLQGKTAELVAEISAEWVNPRAYCFEATTR